MELRNVLEMIHDNNTFLGLSYVGDKDYAVTSKEELLNGEHKDLLESKVRSINAFEIKSKRVIGVKILKN